MVLCAQSAHVGQGKAVHASPAHSLFCSSVPLASLPSSEVPSGSKMGSRRVGWAFSMEGEEEPDTTFSSEYDASAGLQLLHMLSSVSGFHSKPLWEFPILS